VSSLSSNAAVTATADPRISYPQATRPTACREQPQRWFPELYGSGSTENRQAKNACRRCPVAEQCLFWALANPELSEHGIWAATSPDKRTQLRHSLEARLGPDWIAVVADRQKRRQERRQQARLRLPIPMTSAAPAPAPSGLAAASTRHGTTFADADPPEQMLEFPAQADPHGHPEHGQNTDAGTRVHVLVRRPLAFAQAG
jgi:hypothetical protein